MKKLITIALLGLFGLILVGCGGVTTGANTTAATTGSQTTASQTTAGTTTQGVSTTGSQTTQSSTTGSQTTLDACSLDPFAPECITHDNIVLSYADWGDQELNQALIDSFMAKYPNITVELRQDIVGSGAEFTGNLINAQAAGVLPDVFAIDNVPTGISNGMLLDISQYWNMDPDTQLVYPNISDTAVYNGMRLAIPSFQFIKGIYLNITLFQTYNIPIPDKDWTYDDFIALAIQVRQAGINDHVYGIDPWYGDLDFEAIFPTEDNVDVGYQTWDGTQFHFTSPDWINAYNTKLDLWAQGVPASYTPEEMAELGDIWPWYEGLIGMKIDGSWNLWMVDQMYEEKGIEVGFWPYPGGSAGQFPPTILDFSCVSSQTDHPKEAYLLAKWMTFGREGWLTRLDLMGQRGDLYLDRYPIANYPEVWNEAQMYVDYIEGLRESIDLLEYSKPDVDKWLPGYKQFWEWVGNAENDYWTKISEGLVTPDVFAADWETKINQLVQESMAAIGQPDSQ